MKNKHDKEILDSMSRNLYYWRGPFYFNRKDPRLVVPKLDPTLGMTVNFASPYAYILLAGILLVIIASQFLL
ncbi:MAG: hypothetical protein ACEPOZ_10090 [Marinifilaceae bacterium]